MELPCEALGSLGCEKHPVAAFKERLLCTELCAERQCCIVSFDSCETTLSCHTALPVEFPRAEYTGVGFHFPLQGVFPTQGSKFCLLHWQDSFLLSHQESA